ncbi:rod shape-determining protein MreC [bacterium endosymbiont of Pedicinus badii]|uniref:rod shape-determining protein MreC n=1 Tax=bacterium endosymbiont of Pedicinus badii TaxID=1719126 RepID=UPI0009BC118A|nr:rod shape-determining protein MreC [bacterium endosymbiont of Pedicinus badii]OQM34030.1 hypothetical protein AOQ89_01560 [bacterium endosymbiont of Pedicinus badii]
MFTKKNPFLKSKLFILIFISFCTIFLDTKFNILNSTKSYIVNFINTVYEYIYYPKNFFIFSFSKNFLEKLIQEKKILEEKILLKNHEIMILKKYKQENIQLKKLLNSFSKNNRVMLTKVIFVNINKNSSQINIDKGYQNQVYLGQSIINEMGIVGQTIFVNKNSSTVLLVCDKNHAIPIKVLRNNLHTIGLGQGSNCPMILENLDYDFDIQKDDVLVTSGLGGIFPDGYPVAKVIEIVKNEKNLQKTVFAEYFIKIKSLDYLLLIWNTKKFED